MLAEVDGHLNVARPVMLASQSKPALVGRPLLHVHPTPPLLSKLGEERREAALPVAQPDLRFGSQLRNDQRGMNAPQFTLGRTGGSPIVLVGK